MKYLRKFSRIAESAELPTKFDTDALEEVKMIFNDFAEDHNFYVYEWSLLSHPFDEVGVFYTYFSWVELQNKFATNKMAQGVYLKMLETKYFQITINVNEKLKRDEVVPHWRDRKDRYYKPFNKVVSDIEKYFIPQLESIGYKVSMTFGSMSSNEIYTHQISLTIDYSQI